MSANNATSLQAAATNHPSNQAKTSGSASGLQNSPMLANVTNKPHAKNPKTTNSFKSQQMKQLKPLHPLSGGSPTDVDSAYCTEVARRSVARAALHLGMEGMEGMALDALTSVYLGYMDMVRCSFTRTFLQNSLSPLNLFCRLLIKPLYIFVRFFVIIFVLCIFAVVLRCYSL